MVQASAETVPNARRPPALTAETIIGGIYEFIYSRVLHGRVDEFPSLLPDLAYAMMQPYLGHETARREAAKDPTFAASTTGVR